MQASQRLYKNILEMVPVLKELMFLVQEININRSESQIPH